MGNVYPWSVAILACVIGAPCVAQSTGTPSQATPPAATALEAGANDIICQKIEVIGSRLGYKKVCMTRAQWADQQLQDRQATEKAQVQRPMPGQ